MQSFNVLYVQVMNCENVDNTLRTHYNNNYYNINAVYLSHSNHANVHLIMRTLIHGVIKTSRSSIADLSLKLFAKISCHYKFIHETYFTFTYHGTKANPGKGHCKCCHGYWSKVKNLWIHVYWGQSLGKENEQNRENSTTISYHFAYRNYLLKTNTVCFKTVINSSIFRYL